MINIVRISPSIRTQERTATTPSIRNTPKVAITALNVPAITYDEPTVKYDDPLVCYNNSIEGQKPHIGTVKRMS